MQDLSLEVRQLHHVVVDDRQRSHSCGGEGQDDRRAEASGPDDRDVRGGEAPLAHLAEPGENGVPERALLLLGRERRCRVDKGWQWHVLRLSPRRKTRSMSAGAEI